jgi:hypothetical protein
LSYAGTAVACIRRVICLPLNGIKRSAIRPCRQTMATAASEADINQKQES